MRNWKAVLAAASLSVGAASADPTGSIEGRVRYAGSKHASPPTAVPKSYAACGHSKPPQDLLVAADHGLANVVVSVAVPGAKRPAPTEVHVDQKSCEYVPHVQAAPAGSHLTLVNSDPLFHNVHVRREATTLINTAMPIQGQSTAAPPSVLAHAGVVSLRCDAGHTWMSAFIHVFDHPYFAVSDPSGAFRIEGLPPGTYEVTLEHEALGSQNRSVTVAAGAPTHLDVELQ
jgi:hypothetical protein